LGIDPLTKANHKSRYESQNYSLVIRFFVLIASSLIFIGFIFDTFLLQQIDDNNEQNYLQLMQGHFNVLDKALVSSDELQWPKIISDASILLGYSIDIAERDDMATTSIANFKSKALPDLRVKILFTSTGERLFYQDISNSSKMLFIGPVTFDDTETEQYRYLPLFFFGSILVVVWVWMRPMIRDLDILNQTAANLSEDYNASTEDLKTIRTMPQLANVFIKMGYHLKRLINTQKEMSHALSHELRTPLSRIKFALAIAENDMPEEGRKEVQHIYKDLNEMEEIISTLLDYAQLDNPDKVIQLGSVSANKWFMQQVEKFTAAPQGKTITVECLSNDLTLTIDSYLMGLAVSNLINNAIRYGNSVVHITLISTNRKVDLSVEDDGIGIPEDHQHNVFKAFFRMDNSRDKKTGGFGLGLSVVKRIVELHHGTVMLSNSELGGAKFTLQWER